jgi:transcription elongation factor Elf1
VALRKGLKFTRPWGTPLEDLIELDSVERPKPQLRFVTSPTETPGPVKTKRKRSYSPLKSRPACPSCSAWHWIVVTDHEKYRDPFLECGGCRETFRSDLSPLDLQYAWRDGIEMPEEIKQKHERNTDLASYTARFRKRESDLRSALGDPRQRQDAIESGGS